MYILIERNNSGISCLVNPHTGHLSPKREDVEENKSPPLPVILDSGDSDFPDEVELKPDPLTLMTTPNAQGRPRRKRPFRDLMTTAEDTGDSDASDDGMRNNSRDGDGEDGKDSSEFYSRRRGGRLRDPVWKSFHNVGGNKWQCNECSYSLIRPQADRMRKHRNKCQNLDDDVSNEYKYTPTPVVASRPPPSSDSALQNANGAASSAASPVRVPNSTHSHKVIGGTTKFSTNSITRQLRRIADALEESNKLKKLKLGLDPHIPFDGGPN